VRIPIHFVFPRIFACASVASSLYKVEFEINVNVLLESNIMITENFPIVLSRERNTDPFLI